MPSSSQTQKTNKTVGEMVVVPCLLCKRPTNHAVVTSVDVTGEEWYGQNAVQHFVHHQVVQCQGCDTKTFRIVSSNTGDYELDEDGTTCNETVELFPSRSAGRTSLTEAHLLPPAVQRIYEETVSALNNDQPILAGVGIRALVEAVCKDRSAAGSTLLAKIDGLVQTGVLTADGSAILHKLRSLGNDAAHEVKPHKTEQLALALDVCEHLLLGVYVLPHHAKRTFK